MISARFDSYPQAKAFAQLLFEELGVETHIDPIAVSELHNAEGIAFEVVVHVTIDDRVVD